MDLDMSRLLDSWDYQPGQVVVRRFKAKDGTEKIQLRVDLGILQMNAEGRPDGKRPFGHESLLHHYRALLHKHVGDHEGSDEGFKLKPEDCAKLHMESLQYHHRYICLLQLGDFDAVIRDAERNLEVFEFVRKYAQSEDMAWALLQFEPQLLMIMARARASLALAGEDFELALEEVENGLEAIRKFYRESNRPEAAEQSGEILSLETWLEELQSKRPLSRRERLEQALEEAVNSEDYEKAAKVRDELRTLKAGE